MKHPWIVLGFVATLLAVLFSPTDRTDLAGLQAVGIFATQPIGEFEFVIESARFE
jgi:hypothetical protein